jgi:hypothetical protein
VPGDKSKPERYGSVGPGGDPSRIPEGHPTWGCYNASADQVLISLLNMTSVYPPHILSRHLCLCASAVSLCLCLCVT